jgi:hypothetical protein
MSQPADRHTEKTEQRTGGVATGAKPESKDGEVAVLRL